MKSIDPRRNITSGTRLPVYSRADHFVMQSLTISGEQLINLRPEISRKGYLYIEPTHKINANRLALGATPCEDDKSVPAGQVSKLSRRHVATPHDVTMTSDIPHHLNYAGLTGRLTDNGNIGNSTPSVKCLISKQETVNQEVAA